MPPGTKMQAFLNSVRTGETKTTRALERLWLRRGPNIAANFRRANSAKGLPDWLKNELTRQGNQHAPVALSGVEFDHIREWPDAEKEKMRAALIASLGPPRRTVRFRWALSKGTASVNPVDNPFGPGDMTITFTSPQRNVKVVSGPKKGPADIAVDV